MDAQHGIRPRWRSQGCHGPSAGGGKPLTKPGRTEAGQGGGGGEKAPQQHLGCSPSSEQPRARGDVRMASAQSRGGRTRPPRPPGSRKAARGGGRMKTQVPGLPSFLNENLQTAVSWHQWAGPPELGCEGGMETQETGPTAPAPSARAGPWTCRTEHRRGRCAQRLHRGGGGHMTPPRPLGRRGLQDKGQPQATRSPDTQVWTQAQRPAEPSLPWAGSSPGRGGAVLAVAQLAHSAPGGPRGGAERGDPAG